MTFLSTFKVIRKFRDFQITNERKGLHNEQYFSDEFLLFGGGKLRLEESAYKSPRPSVLNLRGTKIDCLYT